MKCKICHTNETDNTSGICWECMNKYYNKIQKDPLNCPFCEAEEKGYSIGWGFSPDGWKVMWEKHLRKHCSKGR